MPGGARPWLAHQPVTTGLCGRQGQGRASAEARWRGRAPTPSESLRLQPSAVRLWAGPNRDSRKQQFTDAMIKINISLSSVLAQHAGAPPPDLWASSAGLVSPR